MIAGGFPPDIEERVGLLSKVSLFGECNRRELVAIAAHTREARVAFGTAVTVEGERGEQFFVLAEGLAWATVGTDECIQIVF